MEARFNIKSWSFALLAAILLMGTQLAALKNLPYASCILEHINSSYEPGPGRAAFQLGSLSWDVPGYVQDPKLEPFRNFYQMNCEGTTGIAAAACVSGVFAKRFPFGAARRDYCDRSYEPAAILAFHLKGIPDIACSAQAY